MRDDVTTAMQASLSASVLRPAFLAALTFASETVYMWTGLGSLTWNGMTFIGEGDLASIGTISGGSTVSPKSLTLGLSGIPSSQVNDVLWETRAMKSVKIWFANFDESCNLIPDPVLAYSAMLDRPSIEDSGDSIRCEITCENRPADLNRECYRRYTADDQQLDLADLLTKLGLPSTTTDTGFRFVPQCQQHTFYWGQTPASSNN